MKLILSILSISLISFQLFSQAIDKNNTIIDIDSYTTFQGYDETEAHLGQGEYQIFLDNIDGVLDKPLVIVDGFDPEDSNNINDLYGFLSYNSPPQNYFDELRDMGFDIVILNFPNYTRPSDGVTINGGADYIERNGLVLVNLIETINTDKVGDEKLIVVGPSMGGIVTRYALTYMEQNAIDHKTGLWVSFDAPHLGANIPISFQYAINYMAELTSDEDMINLRDVRLNSPAAKQLLLDHYTTHLVDGEPIEQDLNIQLPTPHEFRAQFMTTINALGFPTQTRNIAISNGSNNSTMIESPGATIMDTHLDLGSNLGLDMKLHYTPEANTTDYEVDYLQPTFNGAPLGDAYYTFSESSSLSSGLDSCPGGAAYFENFFGSDPTDLQQQILDALLLDASSFIPSLSSLVIDEENWYNSIDGSESTPFEAYINGDDNEQHLSFHQEYVNFLNEEITALSLNDTALASQFVLLGNPVKETIRFKIDRKYSELIIEIFTMTGQLISKHQINNNGEIHHIHSPKKSGVYYFVISNNNKQTLKKFVVNR